MTQSYTYPSGIAYSHSADSDSSSPVIFNWPAGKNLSLQEAREFYSDLSRALGVASYLENIHREAAASNGKSLQEIFQLERSSIQA